MNKALSSASVTAGCLLTIVATPVCVVLNGFALSTLWGWFVSPLFGLPALSIAYAIGIATVVQMLTHQVLHNNKPKSSGSFLSDLFSAILTDALRPLFFLLFGWVVSQFL